MNYVMDIEQMTKSLEKCRIYKREEKLNFDEISKLFLSFKNCYITDNSVYLEELESELSNKFNIVNKIHDDNIEVINKNIIGYTNTSIDSLNALKGIKKNIGD